MYTLTGRSKIKLLLISLLLIFFVTIIFLSSYIIYKDGKIRSLQKSADSFAESVRKDSSSRNKDGKIPEQVEQQLKIVVDLKSPKKNRYIALTNLAFFYSNEYALTNDPSVRQVSSNILGGYAKDNFSDLYNESVFNFICADPKCGQPIPSEVKKVLDLIDKNTTMSNIAKSTISKNLKNAGHMTDKDEGLFGLQLSLNQLKREGTPEASEAAKILLDYMKKEYNYSEKSLPK